MKVRLHNPITGKSRTYRATMTTNHPASHYGLPVMLLSDGEILDVANVVLMGAVIVELPKRKDQIQMLSVWQDNANAMLGVSHG
jgi:hypothetical protein